MDFVMDAEKRRTWFRVMEWMVEGIFHRPDTIRIVVVSCYAHKLCGAPRSSYVADETQRTR